MRLRVLAVGTRMPSWVNEGFDDYAGRLRTDYRLELQEIPLGSRGASDSSRAIKLEGERMSQALDDDDYVVAMQVKGKTLSSEDLAKFLATRARDGRSVAFCIGGPDGLAAPIDARAEFKWSLSTLTLPHGLARVVLAEALYRAVSIIKGQPYHRA
jgi:23S rRNA (pseudouridine1915-N3)-methyltransferase